MSKQTFYIDFKKKKFNILKGINTLHAYKSFVRTTFIEEGDFAVKTYPKNKLITREFDTNSEIIPHTTKFKADAVNPFKVGSFFKERFYILSNKHRPSLKIKYPLLRSLDKVNVSQKLLSERPFNNVKFKTTVRHLLCQTTTIPNPLRKKIVRTLIKSPFPTNDWIIRASNRGRLFRKKGRKRRKFFKKAKAKKRIVKSKITLRPIVKSRIRVDKKISSRYLQYLNDEVNQFQQKNTNAIVKRNAQIVVKKTKFYLAHKQLALAKIKRLLLDRPTLTLSEAADIQLLAQTAMPQPITPTKIVDLAKDTITSRIKTKVKKSVADQLERLEKVIAKTAKAFRKINIKRAEDKKAKKKAKKDAWEAKKKADALRMKEKENLSERRAKVNLFKLPGEKIASNPLKKKVDLTNKNVKTTQKKNGKLNQEAIQKSHGKLNQAKKNNKKK